MKKQTMLALETMGVAGVLTLAGAMTLGAQMVVTPDVPEVQVIVPDVDAGVVVPDFHFDFDVDVQPQIEMALASLPDFSEMPMILQDVNPQPNPMPNPQPMPTPHDADYTSGLKAMNEGRWNDAVTSFDKSATANPDNNDASLFWKAYSLQKLGRKDDAKATCNQVLSKEDKSGWKQECLVLNAETSTSQRDLDRMVEQAERAAERAADRAKDVNVQVHVRPDMTFDISGKKSQIDPDDELKLIALNAVMEQDPQKALPVLHSFIFSTKPIEAKRRALFILARSKDPGAQAMLVEVAKNNADVELERTAVQTMGIEGKKIAPQLKSIYQNATDPAVKRAAISGMFVAGDATDMVELARAEKDISLKKELVSQLSVMKDPAATAYMEELLK